MDKVGGRNDEGGDAPMLSLIIVSYNTCQMTRECLDSLSAERPSMSHEIIVVDNASTDGSAAMIAAHPLQPRLIASAENLGFARANNLAASHARGAYLLLLNPDTLVLDRAVDKLLGFAADRPKAGIWGGRTLFADKSLNPKSCWRRITVWNLFCRATGLATLRPGSAICNSEDYGGWLRDGVREVDIVSGCFLLIRRAFWQRLGGFDTIFFMYGEDADLCLRAQRLGARPAVTPNATIVHYAGASEPTRAGKIVKLLTAKATLIRRHWHPLLAPFGLFLLALWPLSRWLALGGLARLKPRASPPAPNAWREVWRERGTWSRGYEVDQALQKPTHATAVSPLSISR